MSPSDETTPEVRPAPSVEQRLSYALAIMDWLQRIALLADEPHAFPPFHDLRTFADVVTKFGWTTEKHLLAIKKALPASCTNLDAPDPEGES